jgi:DNA invertase Pin-like site-specific DNA recombinase
LLGTKEHHKKINEKRKKLNEEQVAEIRNMVDQGIKISEVARKFKVSHGTVSNIYYNISYGPPKPQRTLEEIIEIAKKARREFSERNIEKGIKYKLCKKYQLTRWTLKLILEKKGIWSRLDNIDDLGVLK